MTTGKYNLIILHSPGLQHVSDFLTVRNMMFGPAPDINVHIVSRDTPVPDDFWPRAAELPTLIFAPDHVPLAASVRGTRMIAARVSKLREAELLARAGVPVPMTKAITPDLVLDEAKWGPFVVLKPNNGVGGGGIRLVRTRDARWTDSLAWPEGDPRRGTERIAQQFVDTGAHLKFYRVMTVMGRPIYANESTSLAPRPPLDAGGSDPVDLPIAANDLPRRIVACFDEEILAFARQVHDKFERFPNMGLDIVRHEPSGQLLVLEFNSSGRTWHLSSDFGLAQQRRNGHDYYGQFNALKVIAEAFIETTRRIAT